jgi:hypothetical protein
MLKPDKTLLKQAQKDDKVIKKKVDKKDRKVTVENANYISSLTTFKKAGPNSIKLQLIDRMNTVASNGKFSFSDTIPKNYLNEISKYFISKGFFVATNKNAMKSANIYIAWMGGSAWVHSSGASLSSSDMWLSRVCIQLATEIDQALGNKNWDLNGVSRQQFLNGDADGIVLRIIKKFK